MSIIINEIQYKNIKLPLEVEVYFSETKSEESKHEELKYEPLDIQRQYTVKGIISPSSSKNIYLYPIEIAAIFGKQEFVKNVLSAANDSSILPAFLLAAANGHYEIVALLLEHEAVKKNIAANNNEALRQAARDGHLKVVKLLLEHEAVKKNIAADDNEAFRMAARNGHLEIVKLLLEHAAVRENITADDNEAFREAAANGHLKVVELLLKDGAVKQNITAKDNQALRRAAGNGHLEVVEILLSHDAVKQNIAANNNEALREAATNGHLEIVKLLLEHAAVRENITANNNEAFREAAANGHLKVVELLLQYEAVKQNITAEDNQALREAAANGHIEIVNLLLGHEVVKQNITANYNHKETLQDAAKRGHLKVVERLLSIDTVKQNITANDNEAFRETAANGHLEVVKLLLKEKAVQESIAIKDNKALRMAARNGHQEVVKLLLEEKAVQESIAIKDNEALREAAANGHIEIVKLLLGYDAVKENIAAENNQALQLAAKNGHLEVVKLLLSHDAVKENIATKDNEALREAAGNGHLKIVELLLGHDAVKENIAAKDNEALRMAAQKGHLKVVKLLLSHDAVKQNIAANHNEALRWAASNGHLKVVKHLLAYDAVKQHISANDNEAFQRAVHDGHLDVIEFLLGYPQVFAYAEMHNQEHGRQYVYPFINAKLTSLQGRKAAAQAPEAKVAFDASEDEATLCFYMIRNLIRREPQTLQGLQHIQFLLDIPAVKNLAHQAMLGGQENELLRLAQRLGRIEIARIFLNIPEVLRIAQEHNFYADEQEGDINLQDLARDKESSMTALSIDEQEKLKPFTEHYDPLLSEQGGVEKVFNSFMEVLRKRYEASPAMVEVDNQWVALPFSYQAFEKLGLQGKALEEANKAYYRHAEHTVFRYLSKPNPWMHPNASYVFVDPEDPLNPKKRWSTFEDYKEFICQLYLAAIDTSEIAKPIDGYTIETRLDNLIKDIELIGRGHNWDKTRKRPDGKDEEEYDDEEGDRPSCFSGVKRRLFQALRGHPLLSIIVTRDRIMEELRDFTVQQVRENISKFEEKPAALIKAYQEYATTLELSDDFKKVIMIDLSVCETFKKALDKKYGVQILSFAHALDRRFELAKDEDTQQINALMLGADIGWKAIFSNAPAEKSSKASLAQNPSVSSAPTFFSGTDTTSLSSSSPSSNPDSAADPGSDFKKNTP